VSRGPSDSTPRSILLLADVPDVQANTVRDHVLAFSRWSRHEFLTFNPAFGRDSRLLDLEAFDAVVVHYSISVVSETHLPPRIREKLRRYTGLKVQFIQDGYRRIDEYCAAIRDLGIRLLFTCFPPEEARHVWTAERLPGVRVRHSLTGYVPEDIISIEPRPMGARPYHVGYRSRPVPPWLGRLGQEKTMIGREFRARAEAAGLHCNIDTSEESRIYGAAWIEFLRSCRAALGTESGASVVDFDGSIERRVRDYLEKQPRATFDEVEEAILAPYEDRPRHATVSPRVFEAIGLHTALVMFPGEYSGVVRPWDHYVPLQPDFSNFDDVARLLRDVRYLEDLTRRAWREIIASGRFSYREGIREFDAEIAPLLGSSRVRTKVTYGLARLETSDPVRAVSGLGSPLRRAAAGAALTGWAARSGALYRRPLWQLLAHRARARRGTGPPSWSRFIADLLRLSFLLHVAESPGAVEFRLVAAFDAPTGLLRMRSVPKTSAPTAEMPSMPAVVRSLVWDHSRIGPRLALGRGRAEVSLGDGGVYPFWSTSWLAETAPALLEEVIAPLRGAGAARPA
jgi:hypothetical protein